MDLPANIIFYTHTIQYMYMYLNFLRKYLHVFIVYRYVFEKQVVQFELYNFLSF